MSITSAPPAVNPGASPAPRIGGSSRRSLLRRSAAVGAVATGASVASSVGLSPTASAATYKPAVFAGAPLLSEVDRHLVSRFSYGVTPGLTADVLASGGAGAWFSSQLSPDSIPDPRAGAMEGWWPSLNRSALEMWQRQQAEIEGIWNVMEDYRRWLLMRRIYTTRPVQEMLTELWMNHLNVPGNGDACSTYRFSYDKSIRANALGRFEDILFNAVTHPAMGIYLDNATSTKAHPNENLGRELLELHTVGRGNYSEDDVKNAARVLTGYRVDLWRTWAATYKTADHWTGPVTVMGFSDANASADGRDTCRRLLTYLARHPSTAARVCRKLAVKFVSDSPSEALVEQLASVYLANDTAITPVLQALVAHPEFLGSAGKKVRDPGEDIVATYRALQVDVVAPPAGDSSYAADAIIWQCGNLGMQPVVWPRPDGQPIDNESWSTPARIMASFALHYSMSGTWWPTQGITYRTAVDWLPVSSRTRQVQDTKKVKVAVRKRKRVKVRTKRGKIRVRLRWVTTYEWREKKVWRTVTEHETNIQPFDMVVDNLAQQLLGRHSTATLLQACCEALGVSPGEEIGPDHSVVKWNSARLLSAVLDTPEHFTR